MSVEAVLFDLDGTLADTAPDLGAAANRLRVEAGLAPLPLERLRPHTSSGARGIQAGRSAGMKTVAAAYGYLGLEVPVSEWQADHIIHEPMELLPVIGL